MFISGSRPIVKTAVSGFAQMTVREETAHEEALAGMARFRDNLQ
jgi:hypothetical protein